MKQQSPYSRYSRNCLGPNSNSNSPGELYLQTKKAQIQNEPDFSISANIYLQCLHEFEPVGAGSGKKQRKIKVFGIPENRIRKDEPIPELFGSAPDRSYNDEKDQMLIDSHMNIPTNSLIEGSLGDHGDICDQNQLRNLLYCSGSSASLPLVEPLAQCNRGQSIRTEEIDGVLQLELRVKEVEKQPSSISQSKINFHIKNTDSAYLSEDFKWKDQQASRISGKNSFVLKELNEEEMSKEVSRSIQQQTIQKSNKNSRILHISNHQIIDQPIFGFDIISPIPKKYDEIMQASVDYDQPIESKVTIQTKILQKKVPEKSYLPLSAQADKVKKEPYNLNIKKYFQSYGRYQQQIQKMINKLQKVTDLKDKESVIKRELQTLTHKKHQSVQNLQYKPKSKPKSQKQYKPDPPNQRVEYNHAFTQSASHFLSSRQPQPLPRNSIDRQLHQDVAKMERILNKFKEISQIISTQGNLDETGLRNHHERSQKNLRVVNYNNQVMFQSEKLAIDSTQLPNYSYRKTTSQPQIQLKIPEKIHGALNDSHQIQSDNYTYNGMNAEPTNRNIDRPTIIPYSTNTVRTQKKPFNGLVERCQSNYNYDLHTQKKCQCSHAKLAQEVAKLTQKVIDMEKEKIRQARSLDAPSHQKHNSIDSYKRSFHEESCLGLIPKQIQEPIQSIKAKAAKQNPHHYSNLQPVSILKPPSTLQHKSILKTEQAKPSPALTKRKTSKDLPPKQKYVSKSPQIKKDPIKENQFSEQINTQSLQIGFPSIICCLTNNSSENSIIKFGQITYPKLYAYACSRKGVKGGKLEEKVGFKIKKYEDCIHYYLQNTLNYHLVCYFKGKIYFGQLKDPSSDCKHGLGYYSTPKYVYQGQFALDKKSGKGKINYSNGDMYQGDWRNGKRQGHGAIVNLAGDIYSGTFQNGKKNGKGEQRLTNGDFYRGQFKDGKLQGEGRYWWSDGSIYQGGFKGGLLHGRGIWRSKENDCYEGQYKHNKKYGKGIYKWSNGMIFSGVFEADQQIPQKKQTLVSPDRKDSKSGQRTMRTRQNSSKKV